MLESFAIALFILWVLGLVSGAFGLAIHLFLVAVVALLILRGYLHGKSRSMNEVSPAGILAIMTRKFSDEP